MQPVHIVPAGHLQHGCDLKCLVLRMGRTQPPLVDRAVITDLHPALRTHRLDKCLVRSRAHVVVHLPDVALHAIPSAGGQAKLDLIPSVLKVSVGGKDLTAVERDARPQHIGQNRGEPVVRQTFDRLIPVHPRNTESAMAPEGPMLAGQRLLRKAVGFEQGPT